MPRRILLFLLALFFCTPVLAEAPTTPTPYIQPVDTDAIVGQIQDMLGIVETNGDGAPAYGERTTSAIEVLQEENQIDVTGDITPETLLLIMDIPADADGASDLVWIPMHGGARYHANEDCSNMDAPRLVPRACATALEFTPCKRCY